MSAIRLEIKIEGPVLTPGFSSPTFGVDCVFLRDLDDRFILPGTLVKGVVRHVLTLMSQAAPHRLPLAKLDAWFGHGSGDARELDSKDADADRSLVPARGIVRFVDLRLSSPDDKKEKNRRITRIAVDDDTGSVRRGMLQVLETPAGYGETVTFEAELRVAGTADEAKEIAGWIKKALELVPALGSAKSAGFGHIAGVCCDPVPEKPISARAAPDPAAPPDEPIGYTLQFAEPLLVASQALSGNLFKSSEEIPGGIVKGALARVIEASGRMPALCEALDGMIIRHAKPIAYPDSGTKLTRPQAMPLSLFSLMLFPDGKPKLDTVLDASDRGILPDDEDYAGSRATVLFPPDWKDDDDARESVLRQLGHTADFKHDVRTRTAIGANDTAETTKLFSRIALDPRGHLWVGEIAQGEADDAGFAGILNLMAPGLPGIGKTGAFAEVGFFKPEPRPAHSLPDGKPGCRRWRILLETDTLLHGPEDVFTHKKLRPEKRLKAQYRDYFAYAINSRLGADVAPVAPDDLHLRFFARQRWAGGYQALRYSALGRGRYYPHLVTQAGSVFVLDAPDSASSAIDSFVSRGLPLPAGVPQRAMQHERSPFVPQNGYGEVSIGDYFRWRPDA